MNPNPAALKELLARQREGMQQALDATNQLLVFVSAVQASNDAAPTCFRPIVQAEDVDVLALQEKQRRWLATAVQVIDAMLLKVGQPTPGAPKKSPWRQFRRG